MTNQPCNELTHYIHLIDGEIIPIYSVKKTEDETVALSDNFSLKINVISTFIDISKHRSTECTNEGSFLPAWVNKAHIVKITIPSEQQISIDMSQRKALSTNPHHS
jgi:hypothetical protein